MIQEILYIGQMIDIEKIDEYSGASVAGALYEWNTLMGLSENREARVRAITVPPVASWPRDKKLLYRCENKVLGKKIDAISIEFWNLPILKQLFQIVSVYRAAQKIICKNPNTILVSYNTFPQTGIPADRLAKKYGLRHICILADLPYDDVNNPKWFRRIVWKIYGGTAWKLISRCREFILLNEKAAALLPKGSRYTVVEGGVDPLVYSYPKMSCTDNIGRKIIMYAGALTQYSGVLQLIEAVCAVNRPDLVLHIYGDGDCRSCVEQAAQHSKCVVYKGRVAVDEIRELQSNAWLLVNPRPIDSLISKVTFPSKILEYMASGTPVLSTKINALTQPYLEKMYVSETAEPKELAETIQKVYEADECEMEQIGKVAREFVLNEKSWAQQSKKMQSFVLESESGDGKHGGLE